MNEKRKEFCPHCEKKQDIENIIVAETDEIRGDTITASVEASQCTVCGKDFATIDQMEQNLEAFRVVYRQKHGILSPDEMRAIREKYGASQKAFGRILGLGDLTINSYEQGALPVEATNNLIKLVRDDPGAFTRLFNESDSKLGATQQKRIAGRLAGLLNGEPVATRRYRIDAIEDESIFVGESAPEYHGYIKPDYRRLVDMMRLILHSAGCSLNKVVLLKILFYIDFGYCRKSVRSMSGWPYARLPYGPVPEEWKDILIKAEADGYLISEPDDIAMGDFYRLPETFDVSFIEKRFTQEELDFVRKTTDILKKKTAVELSEMTHREKGWIETPPSKRISYRFAEDLKLIID